MRIRRLSPNQTRDPARGSFVVHARMSSEKAGGERVFVAPTEPEGENSFRTFSNSIQFIPVTERNLAA